MGGRAGREGERARDKEREGEDGGGERARPPRICTCSYFNLDRFRGMGVTMWGKCKTIFKEINYLIVSLLIFVQCSSKCGYVNDLTIIY